MKQNRIFAFTLIAALMALVAAFAPVKALAQNIATFKLGNGLTVYVCEDPNQHDVMGEVVVRTGSVNDPEQYTGLAHYLEHVMFKGTQKIGALDWEQERPIYEQIIAKYDEMAQTEDEARRKEIGQEINELTLSEGKISISQEYSNLIESIGGNSLNAGTSYDYTVYYNTFPANQISKWLAVSAERFTNPVFRAFQSELETVYEEFNMYSDAPQSQARRFLMEKAFGGTPYARDVIGLGEHLKNPRLSKLIEFYEQWYVPGNMALIISGNVKAQSIIRLVQATYGRLQAKPVPESREYSLAPIKGRTVYSTKCSYYPSTYLIFNGVKEGDEDQIAMEVLSEMLSNSSSTGILDKLSVNGNVMGAGATMMTFCKAGRFAVIGVPYYDESQNRYDSNKKLEGYLTEAIAKIIDGDFSESLLNSVKIGICRDYELSLEDNEGKVNAIAQTFLEGKDINEMLQYKDKIAAVTADDVRRVAAKYLKDNYLVINNEIGTPDKAQKIAKPDYKPVDPPVGKSSAYAQWFKGLQAPSPAPSYVDWSQIQTKAVNSYSKLYYSKNTVNDIYTLVLRFGANSKLFPKLDVASQLMSSAGVMAQYTPNELKEAFAELGSTCTIQSDDDYLYVTLRGYDSTLRESCLLLTKLVLMPALDKQQLGNLRGAMASSRMNRKKEINSIASALQEYVLYGDESAFRTEITDSEILNLDISSLTGDIIKATNYAAEIHYSGNLPFAQAAEILSSNLPLVKDEHPSSAPYLRPMKEYDENTVIFVPNSSAKQAKIFFYIPMGDYDKSSEVSRLAFNQYFSGGFNGLVMQEIREKNSMAYTAYGMVQSRKYPGSKQYFGGFLETQNDKALGAIELYSKLLADMPRNSESISNIKNYLRETLLFQKPDNRSLSMTIAEWQKQGFTEDPAKEKIPQIEALQFDDIVNYYESQLKGKPIVIGIVGDPKFINAKDLAKYGKVVRISDKHLFNEEDVLFQK